MSDLAEKTARGRIHLAVLSRSAGKTQALIESMLAQAGDRGLDVRVVAATDTAYEAALREQVAREIEASRSDNDAWQATCNDYREVGWEGEPGEHERMFWEAGQSRAARIARGGAS